MSVRPGNDNARERLGFVKAVAEHIAPVLNDYGFICTESTPCIVKFQSAQVEAAVSHDRLSYEIGASFARKAEPTQRCTLADLLNAALGPGHKQQTFFQASKADDVAWCVKTIAELLRKYGQAVLSGQRTAYQRIEELSRVQNEAFTKQVVQQPVRLKAEEAWQSHNYAEVQDLYESIEADLTPLEKKRLEYARGNRKTSKP